MPKLLVQSVGIYITNNSELIEQLHVEIKDLLGRVIIDKFINTESVCYLELNELKIGLYFISIRTNNTFLMKNEKLLIQE